MPGSGVGGAIDAAGGLDIGDVLGVLGVLATPAGRAGERVSGWRTAQAYPTVPTSAEAARTPIVHDRTGPPPNQDTSQSLNAGQVPAQHHHGGAPWHREELR
jgi:hypothetical protein